MSEKSNDAEKLAEKMLGDVRQALRGGKRIMATKIEQLRSQFIGLSTAQKGQFIQKLKAQLEGVKNTEYTQFLNECIRNYNSEVRGGVSNSSVVPSSGGSQNNNNNIVNVSVQTNVINNMQMGGSSYFDGGLFSLIGWTILGGIVTFCTCGIGYPWALCMVYGWRINHTVVEGRRLRFIGSGFELFGQWILWWFLCWITCGIYSLWLGIALEKWKARNTVFAN